MHINYEKEQEFQSNYMYAKNFWDSYIENAKTYNLAAAGRTWSQSELIQLAKEGREALELNLIRKNIQFFSGYLRDNLKSVVYEPVEGSDQATADQFTELSYYYWNKGNGYNVFLDAQEECFKSGLALTGLHMTYDKDFINGDIGFYKRTYNSFLLDPTFESLDLSDCGFAITRDLIDRNILKQILPFVDPKLLDDLPKEFVDNKFMQYRPAFTNAALSKNIVAYDQYYVKKTRKREFLVDLDNSFYRDITDLEKEKKDRLKERLKELNYLRENAREQGVTVQYLPNQVEIRKADIPYVELNIHINGLHVYDGEDKTGITETYPFVPNVCYFEPSIWESSLRFQGIASTGYSAQRQFIKRHMKIIDMMDRDAATGYKYILGSVPDPQDLKETGQNVLIGIDADAPYALDSVQELHGGSASPALIEYQKILDDLVLALANVSPTNLGMDEGGNTQVSGRIAEVRAAQGLRSNRHVFDNAEHSQQILGRLLIQCMQKKLTPGKVKRILGEEPTEQFYSQNFEQYDAVVKEGIRSKSQQDAYYYELVNLKREGIVDVPQSEIIKALPIVDKTKFDQAIAEQEKQRQAQQEKLDRQEEIAIRLANSKEQENIALAQERRARVISDIGLAEERASEAEQNRAQAALDRAKTMTEIANLKDEQLFRVLDYVRQMEMEEMQDRQMVKNDIVDTADEINKETEGSAENKQKKIENQIDSVLQNQLQSVGTNPPQPPLGGLQ